MYSKYEEKQQLAELDIEETKVAQEIEFRERENKVESCKERDER